MAVKKKKKEIMTQIKLQISGGEANPAPPVGPALGQHGLNIMDFCKAFNEKTKDKQGTIVPVVITVYEDRTYTFILKTPPASVLLKQTAKLAWPKRRPSTSSISIAPTAPLDPKKLEEAHNRFNQIADAADTPGEDVPGDDNADD